MLLTDMSQQLLFCLRFGLLGLALGVFYDVLRAVRTHFRLRRWGTGLLDMLFCLIGLLGFLLLMLRKIFRWRNLLPGQDARIM